MKRCSICEVLKPLGDFYGASGTRDGLRSECKLCNLARRAAVYRDNPRPAIDRATRWQRDNPEQHKARQREYAESGKKKVSDRKSHLKRRYGLTLEAYEDLLASQDNCCAICGKPDPDNVDHDHVTGRVRGILCWNCNIAIGQLEDDSDRARAVAEYLDVDDELSVLGLTRLVALSS